MKLKTVIVGFTINEIVDILVQVAGNKSKFKNGTKGRATLKIVEKWWNRKADIENTFLIEMKVDKDTIT